MPCNIKHCATAWFDMRLLMPRRILTWGFVLAVPTWLVGPSKGESFADKVISFQSGTTAAVTFQGEPFNQADKALGAPERFTGEDTDFPSVVSPFNPPFGTNEIVSIGEGGHITLRLTHFVVIDDSGPEIGVFTNAGLVEKDFPNGQAAQEIFPNDDDTSFGIDAAYVEVSEDGLTFVPLNGGESILFDIPTNGYTDVTNPFDTTPGLSPSDFSKPWVGGLTDFNGLDYAAMRTLLDGSAGGKWLDLSDTELDQVGFIRFSVMDDGDEDTGLNFELDAVSIAGGFLGGPVPEPASSCALVTIGGLLMIRRKRGALFVA